MIQAASAITYTNCEYPKGGHIELSSLKSADIAQTKGVTAELDETDLAHGNIKLITQSQLGR